jgi:cyclophilin family peptidyl-prolyl cis-trans isomerase
LAGTFDDVDVAGPVVRLDTSLGNVDVELFDKAAPKTSQNFVNYVANNLYNQTVIHRLVKGFILQGGGYLPSGGHIQEGPAVPNESSTARPNVRGTIAMAKLPATDNAGNPVPGGGPDSAKSEWFVNLVDNPGLDVQNGGFTVFGQVINGTMSTVDEIANLPLFDATAVTPVFAELPVRNVPTGAPTTNDFVFVNSAAVIPDTRFLTLAATSDNPSVVTPVVANGVLRLNYGSAAGSARVTVTATDAAGNVATQTFVAGVGEIQVQIGSGGVGSSVAFTEADGGRGSVSISKGGAAFVRFVGNDLVLNAGRRPSLSGGVTRITGITTLDAGTNTTLTVATRGGDGLVDVGGVTTDTPLKALSMRTARLTGTTTVGGTVRSVDVGALNAATVTLGGDPADGIQLALNVGTATDSSLTSGMPIRSVRADEFLTSDAAAIGTITAPGVASVTTKGAFRASINTPGAIKSIKAGGPQAGDITADSLGSLSAAALEGGFWTFSQAFAPNRNAVGKVAVRGSIARTTIRSAGNVGSLSAGSIASGRVYAGMNVTDEEPPPFLPAGLDQFVAPARIASIRVAGEMNQFSVAATSLGKLALGRVQCDGRAISFGLATTQIDALAGRTADTRRSRACRSASPADDPATFDAQVAALGLRWGTSRCGCSEESVRGSSGHTVARVSNLAAGRVTRRNARSQTRHPPARGFGKPVSTARTGRLLVHAPKAVQPERVPIRHVRGRRPETPGRGLCPGSSPGTRPGLRSKNRGHSPRLGWTARCRKVAHLRMVVRPVSTASRVT